MINVVRVHGQIVSSQIFSSYKFETQAPRKCIELFMTLLAASETKSSADVCALHPNFHRFKDLKIYLGHCNAPLTVTKCFTLTLYFSSKILRPVKFHHCMNQIAPSLTSDKNRVRHILLAKENVISSSLGQQCLS